MDKEFITMYKLLNPQEQAVIKNFIRDLLEAHESAASPAPARPV